MAIERFFFILVKLIFEIFCFFFNMTTFVDLIVLVLYLTYCSFFSYFYRMNRLTIFLTGRSTYYLLLTFFISHLVVILVLFLSSAWTWQYLCLCNWSVRSLVRQVQVLVLQHALFATLDQNVPYY